MKSLKNLFVIGKGPSSSHTIGPMRACYHFLKQIKGKNVTKIEATLYGSFALTYKGHHTDKIIEEVLKDYPLNIKIDIETKPIHPNTLFLKAFDNENLLLERTYESIGGGVILCKEDDSLNDNEIYPFKNFDAIKKHIEKRGYSSLYEVVDEFEPNIDEYLNIVFDAMINCVNAGLNKEGKVQAGKTLFVDRSAKKILSFENGNNDKEESRTIRLSAYAYAVGEENATGGIVVTAPTCGSSGIIPSIIYYLSNDLNVSREEIIKGLKVAGMIGNVFKQNATISGAVGGCQAEIGVAVCMATALLCQIYGLSLYQMEYGCELAMEHHLGLTCDPIDGYVVIPCIERNAVGVIRAYEAYLFSKLIAPSRKNVVGLDDIIKTMLLTGKAIRTQYKETSRGGLAKLIKN